MSRIVRPDWSGGGPPVEPETPNYLPTEFADEAAAIRQRDAEIDAEIATEESGLPVPSGSSDLPAALTAQWQADPAGHDYRLREAQSWAGAVLEAVDAGDRQAIESGFNALPSGAQTAVLSELAMGSSAAVRPASDSDLATFAQSDEGAELVAFWRGRAARNLGRIHARVARIQAAMSESERQAASAFFDALPTRGKIAVLCVLSE